MFPSFISILDIQSWWEIPSIAHFCSLFRVAFNLLDFDIEDLEEALLSDGTEDNSWLQELIVRLLRGCLANNEISTINYQMFLRRLFRQKCQEDTNSYLKKNPFDNDIDFQSLPLRTKVEILQTLCDFRLDANDVLDHLKTFEADSLRIEPLGYDSNSSAYWYFYGTRLYREDYPLDKGSDFEKRQYKNLIKKKSIWQVVCFTEQDWENLTEKLRHTLNKSERQLYEILRDNFLPELPKLFEEKEKLHRKRVLERRIPLRSEQLVSKNNQFSNSESDSSNSPLSTSLRSLSPISSASLNPSDYDSDEKMSAKLTTKVGRQTNNSLAAATGNIFIHQPTDNSKRRKLKTSQVFVQSDEDLQIGMHKILECLKNHEDSWPFTDPVEEEYAPGYYSIIRKPMDLQKMEEKLDTGEYNSFTAFKADFQLIVDNCYLYNGSHNEYAEMVDSLQKAFKLATCRYLDNGSSDEEIAVEFPESKVVTPQQNINNGAMNRNNKSLRKIKKKSSSNKKKSKIQPRSRAQKKSTRITGSSRPGSAMDTDDVEDEEDEDDERDKEKVINNDDIEEDDDYETKKENIKDDSDNNKEIVDDNNDTKYIKKFEKWKHQKIKKNYKFNLMKVGRNSKLKASDKKLLETIEKLKAKNDFKQSERTNNNTVGDSSSHSENEKSTNYRQRASATATKRRKKVHKTKNEKRPKIESADNVTVTSTATRLRKRRTQRNSQIKNADDKAEFERNRKKRRKTTTTGSSQSVSSVSSRSTSRSSLNSFDDTINDRKKEKKTEKDLLPKDFKKRQMMLRDLSKVHKKPKMLSNRLHSTKKVNKTVNQPKPTAKLEDSNQNVLNKIRDMKHALNEKTSKVVDGGSKLSLGTVLDSFCPEDTKSPIEPVKSENKSDENIVDKPDTDKEDAEPEEEIIIIKKPCQEKATPNLSAWFKAFGGPKSSTSNATTVNSSSVLSSNLIVKKKVESDTIHSINSTATTTMPLIVTPKVEQQQPSLHPPLSTLPPPLVAQQQTLAAIVPHVVEKVISPQPSPIASDNLSPMPRPRRGSTGSSSSFSQDLDSPRVSVDERLANNSSYLVPFPSPLHKSPMAVSPSLPSPKSEDYSKQSQQQQQPQPQQQQQQQQLPPPPQQHQQQLHHQQQQQNQSQLQVNSQSQLAYNGNIRVGFYQDTTVSVKSSPEKCSSQEPTPNSSPYQSHYQDSMFNSGAVINHNHPDANSYQSSSPLFPFDNNFYQNNPPSSDNDKRITVSPDFTKKRSIDSTEFETKTDNSTGFLPKSSLNVQNGLYGNCIQPSIQCSTTTNNNDNSVDNVFNNRSQCNILESQHYSRSDLQTNTTDLSLKLNDNRLLKLGHLTNTSYPNSNSTDNNNGCNNLRIQDNGNCHRLNNITNLSHIVDRFSTNLNNHNHNHPSPYYTDNNLHHLTTSIYPATLSTPPIQDNGVKKARKTRKTKNGSTTVTTNVNDVNNSSTTHRPFMVDDSSAAKVAMTTNAFNFNPSPASLFPNDAAAAAAAAAAATYLDDFHTNYYIPPPNSAVSDKNVAAASAGAPPPPSFFSTNRAPPTNFAPHPSPFINPHGQATGALLDHNSPLYQQYLLHQGLLRGPPAPTSSTTHTTHGPHGYNAASYHAAAALSMRQPYDSIRPSWL